MHNTALITGGSRRIGRSIALTLAELGYDIAIHYNRSERDALETKKMIRESGVKCEIFKSDLSRPSGASGLIKKVIKKLPGLSLLVNNASIFEEIRFEDVTEKDFDNEFNIFATVGKGTPEYSEMRDAWRKSPSFASIWVIITTA